MKAMDIRAMTRAEAESKLKDKTIELFNLRFQHATGQLENPMKIPETKKDIARINTILSETRTEQLGKQERS